MAVYIESSGPEEKGEHEFFRRMITDLPSDWLIIGNTMFRESGESYEIDALIAAPGRLWVIEVKNWHGSITGDERDWTVTTRHSTCRRKSPIPVLLRKQRKLLNAIKKCKRSVFVDARVVMMAGKREELKLTCNDDQHILFISETKDWLLSQVRSNAKKAWSGEELKQLAHMFAGDRGIRALSLGGEPLKPLAKACQNMFKLTQPASTGFLGFERVYYSADCSRILIGANELRGAHPPRWTTWSHQGVFLHFDGPDPVLEAPLGTPVVLNGESLAPGSLYPLDIAEGRIDIGGIQFEYRVEPYFD